ncbi:MAG: aromatic-ring-hydroxylating dioxygenase subunit beta [Pseudomonadota bacterium]
MSIVIRSVEDLREIEGLLYEEASCLDRGDLDGWIQLYTDDATYWMPVKEDQEDPINHISLFYDNRVMMEIRRLNYTHPRAPSKEYRARSSHIISNIRVTDRCREGCDLTVTSNFHCLMHYHNKQTMFGGTYTHDLVRIDDQLKIRHKKVVLINCDAPLGTIIIYL